MKLQLLEKKLISLLDWLLSELYPREREHKRDIGGGGGKEGKCLLSLGMSKLIQLCKRKFSICYRSVPRKWESYGESSCNLPSIVEVAQNDINNSI